MFQLPTPLQKIETELTQKFDIQLFIKRDDLIHPEISGNKWRKLKYNIAQAQLENKQTLLTFGGAFSNHITATAAAGKYLHFRTIGIIRGEKYTPLNPSLQFAESCGMELFYVDRTAYKQKNISTILQQIPNYDANDIFVLPEGGATELAIKGCAEIVDEINIAFDFICCACGTGTTIAGIASNIKSTQQVIGFPVLKHANLQQEIEQKITDLKTNFTLIDAAIGGYAKTTPQLVQFIKTFYHEHQILLDYVYTGKVMLRLFELIEQGYFPKKSTIVMVHTGGTMNANVFNNFKD